jgi:HK97 family phage major capsid protein
VPVPADIKSGIGRSAEPITPNSPEIIMADENKNIPAPVDTAAIELAARTSAVDTERKRTADITAAADQLGKYAGVREIAAEALRSGWSMDEFRAKALAEVTSKPLPGADIGMNKNEVRQYSMVRALHAMANPDDRRAREAAAFEFEVSGAAADKQGRSVKGILVPFDVLNAQRADDLVKGTASKGGNLVATDLLTGSFIDLLRNKMVVNRLGAQFLSGLVGNIAIPRQTGPATFYMVAESGAPTQSGQAFDQVPMSPKTGAAKTQISRKLLLQSSLDIESFVRNDLATIVGLGMQAQAIKGGGSNEAVGILATAGIGSVVGGTNGLAPTWKNIVDLETAVAVANADIGTLGYLTNAVVRGALKNTVKLSNTIAAPVWVDGSTPLNGYQAAVTNAVPSNGTKGTGTALSSIIFGNFADLMFGIWGGLELQVDPFSAGDSGSIVVRAFQDFDIAVRHAESFSAMTDAITV